MHKLLSIVLSSFILGMIINSCSSDEPSTNPDTVSRTDSTDTDSTAIDSATIRWIDTITPTYPDEYVPYTGAIEPLPTYVRPVFTTGKKWIIWDILVQSHVSDNLKDVHGNVIFHYAYDTVDSVGVPVAVVTDENGFPEGAFKEDGTGVWIYYTYSYMEETGNGLQPEMIIYRNSNLFYDSYINLSYFEGNKIQWAESRGTIVLMGKTRRATKMMHLNYLTNKTEFLDYYVEGIGPLFGNPLHQNKPQCSARVYHPLLECWDGDEKIYDAREFSHDLYTPIEVFVKK